MDQIAEAIWAFGRVLFGADRRRDRSLDQSVVRMVVLSEASKTREVSATEQDVTQLITEATFS